MTNSSGSLGPSSLGGDHSPATPSSPPASPWHWRLEDAAGQQASSAEADGQSFPSQSDAESWVGEVWRDLLEDGVDAVTLFDGDRLVYGPMSLHTS